MISIDAIKRDRSDPTDLPQSSTSVWISYGRQATVWVHFDIFWFLGVSEFDVVGLILKVELVQDNTHFPGSHVQLCKFAEHFMLTYQGFGEPQ